MTKYNTVINDSLKHEAKSFSVKKTIIIAYKLTTDVLTVFTINIRGFHF